MYKILLEYIEFSIPSVFASNRYQVSPHNVGLNWDNLPNALSSIVNNVIFYLSFFVLIIILGIGAYILLGKKEEETTKKSINMIVYIVLGLLLIFLAYSLTVFLFDVISG